MKVLGHIIYLVFAAAQAQAERNAQILYRTLLPSHFAISG
jgi:hypothetical protein